MDAKEFIKELVRMCKSKDDCDGCQIRQSIGCPLIVPENVDAEWLVDVVRKWGADNPLITNGEVLVSMMEKMDAPYIRCRRNEIGQIEMILSESWWDNEYKEE